MLARDGCAAFPIKVEAVIYIAHHSFVLINGMLLEFSSHQKPCFPCIRLCKALATFSSVMDIEIKESASILSME